MMIEHMLRSSASVSTVECVPFFYFRRYPDIVLQMVSRVLPNHRERDDFENKISFRCYFSNPDLFSQNFQ